MASVLRNSYLFLIGVFILCALALWTDANACEADYKRSEFPHWGPSTNGEFKDIRQEVIWDYVVEYNGVKLGRVENGKVVEGLWYDSYTGRVYDINDVTPDMEHKASLKALWIRGACNWTREMRRAVANDKLNLLPAHPSANRKKSADGIAEYMPPNVNYCSEFLVDLKALSVKYPIELFKRDKVAFKVMEKRCHEWRYGIEIDDISSWLERQGWGL